MSELLPYRDAPTLVTAVPTASSRVRLRGYDQAVLIAKRIARDKSLVYEDLLWRIGQDRQLGAAASERKKHTDHAYRARTPGGIKGAHIILVDDVLTTGATIESAARCLRDAGAKTVDAMIFAQKA